MYNDLVTHLTNFMINLQASADMELESDTEKNNLSKKPISYSLQGTL